METLLQDVRYALRSLRKRLLFSAVAILTLAVGIGGTTAIFSVVNAALLKPLPFPDPERIVKVLLVTPPRPEGDGPGANDMVWSYAKYEVLRDEQRIFAKLAGYARWNGNLAGDGDPERLEGELVTTQYFDLLGVRPLIGRTFSEEETREPGRAGVALLGEGLWRSRFNADAGVLGRSIQLDGSPRTIVGVMPTRFRGLSGVSNIFLPMAAVGSETLEGRWDHFMTVMARLDPNVTFERARSDLAVLGKRIHEAVPPPSAEGAAWSATAIPLDELRIDPSIRRSVIVLFGAVTGVLLIACVNVANLLLARAVDRRREIAVRLALGAARVRLLRQLITEALVLALIGGAFGVLLGWLGVRGLASLASNVGGVFGRQITGFNAVSLAAISVDTSVLFFALAASVVTGLLFGAAPALQATRTDLTSALKAGGSATLGLLGVRGLTTRSVLVVSEIALAFMLLVGSGLMLRSLSQLLNTDAGVDPRNLLTVRVSLQQGQTPDQAMAFWQQLLARTSTLPGVQNAAIADCPPLVGGCNGTVAWIRDRPPVEQGSEPTIGVHWVTDDYFKTLRVPLKSGRVFEQRDTRSAPKVIIINETAARKLFPGENPVGRRIGVGQGGFADGAEIIGVVGDQRFRTMEAPPEADAYISYNQSMRRYGHLYLRTSGEPTALASAIRREVRRLDPNLPIYDVQTMEQRVGAATARTRVTGLMLALFATVALLLALVGIYGVVAYAVTQRTREIGVRIALGAVRSDVAALVLRYGTALVALGVIFGLLGAWSTTRVLRALLYEVEPTDPIVFASLTVVTMLVALAASAAPAVRAMRIDPLVALKTD
jgi:putative ABC transport system permease protein